MDIEVKARVRGLSPSLENLPSGSSAPCAINPRGDLLVAQALPPYAEIVRMGNSYFVIQSAATTPNTILPTTTAPVTLWNGENDGGKVYIIDSVFAHVVVSAAAATNVGLCGMLNLGRKAAPTGALTPKGLAGHNYKGRGLVGLAVTVTDDSWHPLGNAVNGPASQVALNVDIPLFGAYIVPPGGMFSISALANTGTTITVRSGIRWHEVQLPIGP